MPRFDTFNINESHLEEVLRVKRNMLKTIVVNQPLGLKTTQPKKEMGMATWFNHIKNSLRVKDLFGNIEIK